MTRTAWISLTVTVLALGLGIAVLAVTLSGGEGSKRSPTSTVGAVSPPAPFELPLALKPSTLALATHRRDLIVGIAARAGGPVEVAAVRAESPVPAEAIRLRVRGHDVNGQSCGRGCSLAHVPVLDGARTRLSVLIGSTSVSFDLPARLPPSGRAVFARALKTMRSLRSFHFTEQLSSGRGGLVTKFDIQAPDRLRLRTADGFRAVIIGRTRWDFRGGRWERTSFPGLVVTDVLMWHRARSPRIVGHRANGVTELSAFGLEPVPAWFRVLVAPSGRVVEAEMTAPSHFMKHRYGEFNRSARIKAPK